MREPLWWSAEELNVDINNEATGVRERPVLFPLKMYILSNIVVVEEERAGLRNFIFEIKNRAEIFEWEYANYFEQIVAKNSRCKGWNFIQKFQICTENKFKIISYYFKEIMNQFSSTIFGIFSKLNFFSKKKLFSNWEIIQVERSHNLTISN